MAAIAGALFIYWWDSTYKDQIADGVTIGGVDVAGMEEAEATAQLQASLITPLEKNVVVTYEDEKFKLEPEELDIRADIDGMVDEAIAASQDGGILGRTVRRVTGGEIDHQVDPRIAYSKSSVSEFVEGVAGNLNRDPVNASVEPSAQTLEPVPSKRGIQLQQEKLTKQVEQALQDPEDRKVGAEVVKTEPDVTTDELADQYATYVTVDRANFQLNLYKDLKLAKSYTVAIGAQGFDTPAGLYHIQNKQVDPVWNVPNSDWAGELAGTTVAPGPDNPLKSRWMGIYDGAGIHGTTETGSLGSAASHGCVRMSIPDVEDLYDRIDVGTPIYIA